MSMRTLSVILAMCLGLVLCASFASPVTAQSERQAINAFKKGFMHTAKKPKSVKDRRQSLRMLDGYDSKAVAQILVKGYANLSDEVDELVARRIQIADEIRAMWVSEEPVEGQTEKYDTLASESESMRRRIDARHALQFEMRERIGDIRSEDGLDWLVSHALRNKSLPVQLKLQIAQTAGAFDRRMVPDLVQTLKRSKTCTDTCVILGGLCQAGHAARDASADIIALLDNDDPSVRERAAWALSKIADPRAIEPMIELLDRESGASRRRIAASLEILTGQSHGTNAAAWKAWWAEEADAYLAGERELGKGEVREIEDEEEQARYERYHGIPQDGRAMVYIIDASGSMSKELERRSGVNYGANGPPTRLEACKTELIKALGSLKPDQLFSVIWYNDQPHAFKDHTVAATPEEIQAAQDWVSKLQPVASTNIYDSLQMGFAMGGHEHHDNGKNFGICLDTIFLLTDGSPTKVDGKPDSTERILAAVRDWNALERVTIHTIGIGQELNEGFLKELAEKNGGQFSRF